MFTLKGGNLSTQECRYPSLTKLPNTTIDCNGFLKLGRENIQVRDLRTHLEYLFKLPPGKLHGTKLSELLNWCRWAAENTTMWECTAGEMLKLVQLWEKDNPEATEEQYGIQPGPQVTWDMMWDHAQATNTWLEIICTKCNKSHNNVARTCPGMIFKNERQGPRGKGTYNLVLEGIDGYGIAEAAFLSRGQKRTVPTFNLY